MTQTLSDFITADQVPKVTTRLEDGYKIELEILSLQEQIKDLETRKMMIIEDHVNSGVMVEGPFSVKKTVRTREALDPDAFAEKYPAEFDSLWREIGSQKFKPSKADAAKVLTSHQIEKVSKKTESVTYSVEWDLHAGVEL